MSNDSDGKAGPVQSLLARIPYKELVGFLAALVRIWMGLVLLSSVILGEWYLKRLVTRTILEGNSSAFDAAPLQFVEVASIWLISLAWLVYVAGEVVYYVVEHSPLPRL